MELQEIASEADLLSDGEKASLVSHLLQGLGGRGYEVSDEEVARRVAEGEADPGSMIGFDELLAGVSRRAG